MKDATILPSANIGVHGYSQSDECEKFSLGSLWENIDGHLVVFQFADNFSGAFGEDLEGFTASPCEAELPRSLDEDGGFMSKQESELYSRAEGAAGG